MARLERMHGVCISHEWMYQSRYADKRAGGALYRGLRCQKPRRKRDGTYNRRGVTPHRVSIDERPAIVDARQRVGAWEGDTVIGKAHRGALVTLVECKSRYTVIRAVRNAVTHGLSPYQDRVHPITEDNSREFTDQEGMARDLEIQIYLAHPYAGRAQKPSATFLEKML